MGSQNNVFYNLINNIPTTKIQNYKKCLKKIKKKFAKIDIIVIRCSLKNVNLCNSHPCGKCIHILKALGVKRVYYTDKNTELVSQKISLITSCHDSQLTQYVAKRNY